jgi:hypothetical protein
MATPHEHSLIRNNTQYEDQKGNLGFSDHKGFKDLIQKMLNQFYQFQKNIMLLIKSKFMIELEMKYITMN